jgi:hypothetical protein
LPSNDRGIFTESRRYLATIGGYTYKHTGWWEKLFNWTVEMGSGAVMYVPYFMKIGSGVQKLIRGIHRHTHRQQHDLISLLYFLKMRNVG